MLMTSGQLHPKHETAGHLAVAGVLTATADETLAKLRSRLMVRALETMDVIVVVDARGKYAGAARLQDVLAGNDAATVASIVRSDWPSVPANLDQEQAVEIALAAGIATLPVCNAAGDPVGCIPASALLRVLAAEHREDVHRTAGILKGNADARHALEDPPFNRYILRLPWLLIGLALSAGGTVLMASFQHTLEANVAIAFFIPAIVYLTDAIGTQTEAVAVRGLSVAHKPLLQLLAREVTVGALIGGTLGLFALVGVWIGFGDWRLATGVALSLFAAGTVASAIGLALPWAFGRVGIDPAFGAGPVATIIQDVLTLMVYFGFMVSLMPISPTP